MIRLEQLADETLSGRDKGLPDRAVGLTVREFLATDPRLSEFWTPLVVLDDTAMRHNVELMARWTGARGFSLMPHGKTTMAPALWQRQLDAGSIGITLATMGQVRAGRAMGLDAIMLANAAVDERSLGYLAGELADPDFDSCWADSLATVDAMEHGLRAAGTPRRVDVCVELGAAGGRTGARSVAQAVAVAERIAASDVLRLAGVAAYEGSLGHDRSEASVTAVRRYLAAQLELHDAIGDLYDDHGDIYVTVGGSAYFDLVDEVFAPAIAADQRTLWTLRSGAYIVHDDGFYRRISPLDESAGAEVEASARLRSAMLGIGRVVSHPEAGLSLLDGGKRDFPFDEGLPIPRLAATDLGTPWSALDGATVTALNDQHSYLSLGADDAPLGSVVGLGLSHPCTTFDKWHYLPVVEGGGSDRVVELVRTFF